MAILTLKAVLDTLFGMLPELQAHFKAGKGGATLTDVDLDTVHAVKDPVLAGRQLRELESLLCRLKEFAQQEKITWTVPTLPNTADTKFRMRLAVNAAGYLLAFVALHTRDRVNSIANARRTALRHKNGIKSPP